MDTKIHENDEGFRFRFNKVDAITGYAFMGAWVGLILGFTGLVGENITSQVSLILAAIGAGVGAFLVLHKK